MARFPSRLPGTTTLIIIAVVVFFVDLITSNALLVWGALSPRVWAGEWQRIIAPNFLHSGVPHLLFNMYALYIFGRIVEELTGTVQFLAIFFISGLIGFGVSLLASPGALAVGASAALFGLMGYTLHFRIRRLPMRRLPIDSAFLQIFGLNLLIAFVVPNIDHYAHVGGLLGGILAGGIVGLPHRPGSTHPDVVEEKESIGLALVERIFAGGLGALIVWASLSPLSFGSAVGSQRFQEVMHARYGSYFTPFMAVDGTLLWLSTDDRQGDWIEADSRIVRPDREPIAIGLFWRWVPGAGRVSSASYEVHWRHSVLGGQWHTVQVDRGQVSRADPQDGYIYRRSMIVEEAAGAYDGAWQVVVFVEDIEQFQRDVTIAPTPHII